MRWGSPTATTPFEPLDLAPKGCVLPSLIILLLPSVFFRVRPWLILLLLLGLPSVASLLLLFTAFPSFLITSIAFPMLPKFAL